MLLGELSPDDFRFPKWRGLGSKVAELYRGTEYEQYSKRMQRCANYLRFKEVEEIDEIMGVTRTRLVLKAANFCRVRFCPMCQWRRSMMWHAKVWKKLSYILEEYPDHRWIAVTAAPRNCSPKALRQTLKWMNKAKARLLGTAGGKAHLCSPGKYLHPVVEGYICTTEVTRGKDNSCHPHFHMLLLVKPEYFDKEAELYIPQQSSDKHKNPGWVELWQEAFGVSYKPTAHVKAISCMGNLSEQISEVLKYNTKPSAFNYKESMDENGLITKEFEETREWLLEVTRQVHNARFIETGGCIKKILRGLESEPENLIHSEDDVDCESGGGETRMFGWIGDNWNGLNLRNYVLVDDETQEPLISPEDINQEYQSPFTLLDDDLDE